MKQYKKRGRPMKKPNKTEFDYLYYIIGLNSKQMAEKYNVLPQTVLNWASEYRKLD